MARRAYEERIQPWIGKIAAWAEAGATIKEIAKKLGVADSTLRKYLASGRGGDERYTALSEALTRACEVPDDNVEAALYKRACGYSYEEVRHEQKLDRSGNVVELTTKTVRDVPPDPTSAMFWLTNRRPGKWAYKPKETDEEQQESRGVIMIPEVGPEVSGNG